MNEKRILVRLGGLLALLVSMIVVSSCSSSSGNDNMQNLAGSSTKLWKFVRALRGGEEFALPECMLDEYLIFNRNGTGALVFGETHCTEGSTTDNDHFTWSFANDDAEIHAQNLHPIGGENEVLTIIELTESSFVYEDTEETDAGSELSRYYLEPVVVAKDSNIPFELAGSDSKIWKFDKVIIDGEELELLECQKDEWVIYSKDGTGLYVAGENDCDETTTINSDHFTYSVVDNGQRITASGLLPSGGAEEDLQVVELTESTFRFVDVETLADGSTVTYDDTMVPALD